MRLMVGINTRVLHIDINLARWISDGDDAPEVHEVSSDTVVADDDWTDETVRLGFQPNP